MFIRRVDGLRILHFRVYYSGGVWRLALMDTSEHRQRDTLVGDG